MRRLLLVAGTLMAGSTIAPCQSGFITHFSDQQGFHGGRGCSVFPVNDGYLIYTEAVSDDGTLKTRVGVYKIDAQGQYQWRNEFLQGDQTNYNIGFFDPMDTVPGGAFIGCISRFGTEPRALYRARFDPSGGLIDTLKVLVYPIPDSIWIGCRAARRTSDGGLILGGYQRPLSTFTSALLVRLDSEGDTLWTNTFGVAGNRNDILGVAEYIEKGYVAVGNRLMSYVHNNCFLLRTDSLGEQLWRREFGNDAITNGSVRVTSDGNIATWSEYKEPEWPDYVQQMMLTKWSPDGDMLWQRRTNLYLDTHTTDMEVLADGGYMGLGCMGAWGAMVKYNASGDSLWTRYLHLFTDGSTHLPRDIEPTSDGGFVITGEAYQGFDDPTPNLETIWVIKTDSLGCAVPGCQNVGVDDFVIDLQDKLRISPNPANDVFTLSLDLPEGSAVTGEVQAMLLDAQGKLVLQQTAQQHLNQLRGSMDVRSLAPGTYYLHLRDAKRWLAGAKVVVE